MYYTHTLYIYIIYKKIFIPQQQNSLFFLNELHLFWHVIIINCINFDPWSDWKKEKKN